MNGGRGRRVMGQMANKIKKEKMLGEYVYGHYSVLYALQGTHRKHTCLWIQESLDSSPFLDQLATLAKEHDVPVKTLGKNAMSSLSAQKPHQGVILETSLLHLPILSVDEDINGQDTTANVPVVLACDEIQDPQNYGALIRTACFLGCTGIISSLKNTVSVTPAVSRASAGAVELLASQNRIWNADQLPHWLQMKQTMGWQIIGTSGQRNAQSVHEMIIDRPTILVVGNEHKGMRTNVRKVCDTLIRIPGAATAGGVDSLNVSVATGIVLHQMMHLATLKIP